VVARETRSSSLRDFGCKGGRHWVRSEAVRNHTEQDRTSNRRRQDFIARQAFIQNDDGEHDAGEASWAKPANKQLAYPTQARTSQT
jgi:hypothetical protein